MRAVLREPAPDERPGFARGIARDDQALVRIVFAKTAIAAAQPVGTIHAAEGVGQRRAPLLRCDERVAAARERKQRYFDGAERAQVVEAVLAVERPGKAPSAPLAHEPRFFALRTDAQEPTRQAPTAGDPRGHRPHTRAVAPSQRRS